MFAVAEGAVKYVVPTDTVLTAFTAVVPVVISKDPQLTYSLFENPTQLGQTDDFVLVGEGVTAQGFGLGQLNFFLNALEELFIFFRLNDVPTYCQLFFEDLSAETGK